MDRMVAQPACRHDRPALYAFEGRSFPEIGWPATDPSDMLSTTGVEGRLFRAAVAFLQGLRHPFDEALRDVVAALLANDDAQLRLEVVGLEAGRAVVEVVLDQDPSFVGELAVEVVVQQLHSLYAMLIHVSPHARVPVHADVRIRITASGAPFFRDGGDSSQFLWVHREFQRSPCTRTP